MEQRTYSGTVLSAEQHATAAQDLLIAAASDERFVARAQVESALAGASAVLQLCETLAALGSLLAVHPVFAHALATRQAILELEESAAVAPPGTASAAATRTQ